MPMMMAPPPNMFPGYHTPGAVPNLMLAQDKINRELFVGNTPAGTSEMLLREFLNGAMRRTNLVAANATPVIQCRVSAKFAFIECATVDDANKALNLNGIPFMGMSLKLSRPSKYVGPHFPAKTWQELTGQPLPPNCAPVNAAEEKVNRELFIGNTTPEMTEQMLTDFLGKAMEQVGLTTSPGNPITSCRVSGKFAFVELRSKEETANALNLNNIPYLGAMLRVGRPSKYAGPHTSHGNWEDILAKYMSGELKLPSQGGPSAAPPVQNPTKVVVLKNMLTKEDLAEDQEYEEILEDTKEECSQFGLLKNIEIPRSGPGESMIFLEYVSADDASKAVKGLQGRTFDGKKVEATFYDEEKFADKDYSV
eukprot:CAMPEP_0195508212 /NCGR_PEP_ID=MMETSP0794_2-20130614/1487_1 /TAXON_ID=515487 /ORGANISM="Stephanopyxis turris, Strain CCMP 815" /LENGTH=365 /DNA_ID=CAMNT_0040635121 /DNA_START=631 /DNA_END=1728 /DNA_ORIENTATION=-